MSWKGTFFALLLAVLALGTMLFSGRSHMRRSTEPLLGIDPAVADNIVIRESGRTITLCKQSGVWMLQGRVTDRADPSLVRTLLSKAAEIVPLDILKHEDLKGPTSLEALDLKLPRRSITVTAGKIRTLSVGIPGPAAGQLYARIDSAKEALLIPSGIEVLAFRPEEAFRDPRLTSFSSDRLNDITLTKKGGVQQISLRKDSLGWNLLSPVSAQADQRAALAWADGLLSAKIDRWMPPGTDFATCGLDAPSAVVLARGEGDRNPLVITIGAPVPEAPDKFYVRCSDRPGICVVSGLDSLLQVSASNLRSKQMKHVELDAIDKVQITQPSGAGSSMNSQKSLLLERKAGSDDWEVRAGGTGILPGSQVRAWYEGLMATSCRGFEAATPEKIQLRGLNVPTEIRLVARLSENTAEENAGEMVLGDYFLGTASNGVVALREGSSPELMIMPESVLEPLIKSPGSSPAPESVVAPVK